jgi:hypothetical protein
VREATRDCKKLAEDLTSDLILRDDQAHIEAIDEKGLPKTRMESAGWSGYQVSIKSTLSGEQSHACAKLEGIHVYSRAIRGLSSIDWHSR